ncbi:MAG: hypothetical protein N3D11_16605 [Candidatus Sumerlaeia bacterium]|nr:hypothetical protein [Candidatus Sumerlaeia bacterium]
MRASTAADSVIHAPCCAAHAAQSGLRHPEALLGEPDGQKTALVFCGLLADEDFDLRDRM